MNTGIILLGPDHVGKAAVGQYLATQLQLPYRDFTAEYHTYLQQTDYIPGTWAEIYRTAGFGAAERHMMPIRAQILVQALADFGPAVVKLGGFDSIYEDPQHLKSVKQAFSPYAQICHRKPSPDRDTSIQFLEKRNSVMIEGLDWNTYFVRHPANRRLAKKIIYTKDQTPAETATAILNQLDPSSKAVFLIGPIGTGKTTIGSRLSAALDIPQVSMDGVRRGYYAEAGYTHQEEQTIQETDGFPAVLDYWNRFEVHATKRVIEEFPEHIVDFGAGQTVLKSETEFAKLETLLAPFPNVFYLLPSPDEAEAVNILTARQRLRTSIDGIPMLAFQLTHPSNATLRISIVYTADKTTPQIARHILHAPKI